MSDGCSGVEAPTGKGSRYLGLDSARGAAAAMVVLHHAAFFYLDAAHPVGMMRAFLKVLQRFGHSGVVIFFVLSGFVLFVNYGQGKRFTYPAFVVQRVFRIHAPYLVALGLELTAFIVIAPQRDASFGPYWNQAVP